MRPINLFIGGIAALAVAGLLIDSSYLLHILILAMLWCLVVASWDLLMGFAGILNFGQLVFFAVGGYASQMLAMQAGLTPLVALASSVIICALFGLLIGLPCLRLRGEYVALFTFAVHLAFPTLLQQGRPFGTGGSGGLMGGTPLEIAGYSFVTADKTAWYFLALGIMAFCVWLIYFVLLKGRWGRAFIVLRDAEVPAKSLGVNEFGYKLLVFMLSAAITGLAGALYTNYVGVITPNILGNEFFLIVMVMLCVGGLGRFPGVLIGAFVITLGNEYLRDYGQYRLILLGLAVIVTLLVLPNGLVDLPSRFRRWRSS
ncbi:branched-chain amino acid ABC transporter permease [Aquipseudomonas campi]